ncbi:MAG: hypothetical protein KC912_14035, partial [Proteobacteria bacterium]|nr:hypothetical protein [Pseudomonadota bacterium]
MRVLPFPDVPSRFPILLLVAFVLLGVLADTAQAGPVALRKLAVDDGLSQNHVSAVIQGPDGYVWFATAEGLDRTDGYDIERFAVDPDGDQGTGGE